MNNEEIITNSKRFIAEGKTEKAVIEIFQMAIDFGYEKEIIIIHNKYKQTKQAELLNLIDRNQINVEKSQLANALINLIQDIENKLNSNNLSNIHSDFKNKSILSILASLIYEGFEAMSGAIAILAAFFIIYSTVFKKCNFPNFFNSRDYEDKMLLNSEILKISDTYRFSGSDNNGKKAEMIIYFVKGFNWAKEKIAVAEDSGKEFEICNFISSTGIVAKMNSNLLKGIICFGNASFEEDLSIPLENRLTFEEDRADKRADKLAECVNKNVSSLTPIYKLNLGKYLLGDLVPKYQRQIIVVGIVKNDEGVVNSEALINGLIMENSRKNIEFDILSFSKVLNGKTLMLKK